MTEKEDMEQFIKQNFPFESDFEWQGREAVVKLDEDRRAVIQLAYFGTHEYFNGFLVTIKSKRSGFIDERRFYFAEIMGEPAKDSRGYSESFKVIRHCGWHWYISTPTKDDCYTVVRFIAEYLSSWI